MENRSYIAELCEAVVRDIPGLSPQITDDEAWLNSGIRGLHRIPGHDSTKAILVSPNNKHRRVTVKRCGNHTDVIWQRMRDLHEVHTNEYGEELHDIAKRVARFLAGDSSAMHV